MQYFYINKDSNLPLLKVELVDDGRFDFMRTDKFNNAIQNADVTFSMYDEDGKLKISKAPCSIVLQEDGGCVERYVIVYTWQKRDTKERGSYKGVFTITFKNDLKEEGVDYPGGDLIMPIYEDLTIMIK